MWELEEENSYILPALSLSYDRMPIELKPCFKYLSLFPKDSKLNKDDIVLQWMSQGFLQPKGKNMEVYIGYGYFNELLQRSILQKSDDVFIMHDLIHDMAQYVAKDEYLSITTLALPEINKSIRHVSLYLDRIDGIINWRPLFKAKQLLTFIFNQRTSSLYDRDEDRFGELCENLKCLRTLILPSESRFSELSRSIGGLKHLRFFGIRFLHLMPIPDSMYDLYHLQILVVYEKSSDELYWQLPGHIGDLINLRHLLILRGFSRPGLQILPAEVGRLTSLQTLPCLLMGDREGQFKVRHSENLSNLRGHVVVQDLQNVGWSDVTPSQRAYLSTKAGIEKLTLHWDSVFPGVLQMELAERVLEYLRPHSNLRDLEIEGYPGGSFPMWVGDASFSRLQSLDLVICLNCTNLPRLFQLPALRFLRLRTILGMKSIGPKLLCSSGPPFAATEGTNGGCGFPSLESLEFFWMPQWEEWHVTDEYDFPRLRCLEINRCSELTALPYLSSLVQLQICHCPQLGRLPSLPSLTKLILSGEWNSEVLSAACLPVLRVMRIELYRGDSIYFRRDSRVPASQWLQSVEELHIQDSHELMPVSGLCNLVSLRRLTIDGCPKLHICPNDHLPKDLEIVY